MMRISKSVMAVGGVVLASMLIGFTNPKAVHAAVTALLVQVTNTASNPVVTQGVGQQAGQIVQLLCLPGGACYQQTNGQTLSTSGFVVPADRYLVVTAVDLNSFTPNLNAANGNSSCASGRDDAVYAKKDTQGAEIALRWEIVSTLSATHFTYPSGVVFGPSTVLIPVVEYYNGAAQLACTHGSDTINLYGYLTTN